MCREKEQPLVFQRKEKTRPWLLLCQAQQTTFDVLTALKGSSETLPELKEHLGTTYSLSDENGEWQGSHLGKYPSKHVYLRLLNT